LTVTVSPACRAKLERPGALPSHSIVCSCSSIDAKGDTFLPLEYMDRVTATANVPTYSWIDSAMNHGIVGGSLKPGSPDEGHR
jgi:hypothetical protein